jgi:hypothetical protein
MNGPNRLYDTPMLANALRSNLSCPCGYDAMPLAKAHGERNGC